MKVFELHPSSLPNGEFAAAWFDDEQLLWDDDLLPRAVTATIDALPEFSIRRAPPPSGNVVELYEFPVDFACPASFFRVRQPADSAAGRAGYCLPEIYVNDSGARAVTASCAGYWEARPLPRTV
jgi:hypothetical protein